MAGTRHLSVLVLGATVALILNACSTSAREEGQPSESSGGGAVTLDDLLSAPVPALCKHEPGHLVNGKLPLQNPSRGEVVVATRSAASNDYLMTLGDLTTDGKADGAMVVRCSAGGVPWPQTVQLYTAGPKWLGGVDLGDLTHGREIVTDISISDGVAHVVWLTNGPNDPACCPKVEMKGDLRWNGTTVVAENLRTAG